MSSNKSKLRNLAVVAHVDHGKTTLINQLLIQSGALYKNQIITDRILDSNSLEKERGITILSKNCSIKYNDIRINILDTPGHADFGGEVERVLSMVDGVLILIDAVEGPMPQTIFIAKKFLSLGLKPIVVINKIDRIGSRPDYVIDATFDLFDQLGATDEQLDFPIIYTSGLSGFASLSPDVKNGNMEPLFEAIIKYIPQNKCCCDGPFQMQITSIDYDTYIGQMGIGRINRGFAYSGMQIAFRLGNDGPIKKGRINRIQEFHGLERVSVDKADAGNIVSINVTENIDIGTTISDPNFTEPLPILNIDSPTFKINLMVNNSPFAGHEGKFITSRQIYDRLTLELKSNVALRVSKTNSDSIFEVSGRGELHLAILLETMRREGYELAVSCPEVIYKEINGVQNEPFESLIIRVENIYQGHVMKELSYRQAELKNITPDKYGSIELEYIIPSRFLIGFQNDLMTITHGKGVMNHTFNLYRPVNINTVNKRKNGVLVSQVNGNSVAYSIWKLQNRGRMFITSGEKIYKGMIIGIHNRYNDLIVNPTKEKKLSNVRASGNDEAIRLVPPIQISIEYAISFINEDELVEITPKSIRLRKR